MISMKFFQKLTGLWIKRNRLSEVTIVKLMVFLGLKYFIGLDRNPDYGKKVIYDVCYI